MIKQEVTHKGGDEPRYVRRYEDYQELIQVGQDILDGAVDGCRTDGDKGRLSSLNVGDRWYSTQDMPEAIKFAKYGWAAGKEKLDTMTGEIMSLAPQGYRIHQSFDVSGDEPDVANYLAGVPEDMITLHDSIDDTPGKFIKILCSLTASHTASSEELLRLGAAVYITTTTLIELGYTVDITMGYFLGNYEDNDKLAYYIPLLHAGDPINMDTLSFWLINPSVLRRFIFAAMETETEPTRKKYNIRSDGGYGRVRDASDTDEEDYNLIVTTKNMGGLHSDSDVIPLVNKWLQSIDVNMDKLEVA